MNGLSFQGVQRCKVVSIHGAKDATVRHDALKVAFMSQAIYTMEVKYCLRNAPQEIIKTLMGQSETRLLHCSSTRSLFHPMPVRK